MSSDNLKDYTRFEFNAGRWTHEVFRGGSGPAVNLRDDDPAGPTKRAETRVIEFFTESLQIKAV